MVRPIIADEHYQEVVERLGDQAARKLFRNLAEVQACRHDLTSSSYEESMSWWNGVTLYAIFEKCESCERTRLVKEVRSVGSEELPDW